MAADFFEFMEKVARRKTNGSATATAVEPAATGGPLTVSQLTSQIDRALKDSFPHSVLVRGEMSNFNNHRSSGHLYFTLKDPGACLDCVMFKSDAARLKFTPEDGIEVLVSGRVGVYMQKGKYQLYVTRIEPLGKGALELAFRQLCAKLDAEGLFAPERKKLIPAYPQRIAIVTSTHTAALQDMLKVLTRFAWLRIMICHVPVQGDGSAERIASVLADLNRRSADLGGIDVILLGRGGGSLEDLWEFNEEIVARAIVASRTPIVTGIGHEIDVSIADLAADYHAHTPTEAAQVVTANWRTAREAVEQAGLRLRRELEQLLEAARQRLAQIERHEIFRRPLDRINAARQLLDDRQRALALAMSAHLRIWQDRLSRFATTLGEHHPRHRVELHRQQLSTITRRLDLAIVNIQQRRRREVNALAAHLNAVGPQQVLNRGYSITTLKKTGAVVRSASQVKPGERLLTRLAEGTIESTVEDSAQLKLFE